MTEEGGSGTRLVCPACGRGREAGGRFCPGCGLDYWRLAAGGTIEAAGGAVPKKRRFAFGRRQAPTPTPIQTPTPTPLSIPPSLQTRPATAPPPAGGAARRFGPVTPTSNPAASATAATPAQPSGMQRTVAAVRIPESPRSRLLLGGGAAVVVLLIAVALIMRPAAPAGTGSTSQPAASAPAPDDVIASFFTSVRDPAAAFEVKVSGTYTRVAGGKQVAGAISGDLRVVGDSVSGTLRLAEPGNPTFDGSIVRIGLQSWTRNPGGAWRSQTLPPAAEAVNPFAWIATVDDLDYVRAGPGNGGQRTHILDSTKWLSGTQYDDIIAQLSDPQRDSRLEVETTDKGVPLDATYQFTIRGTPSSGGTLEFGGSTQYTFSHWNEPFTIGPPA
jgi:hypothetical protein